MTKYVIYIVSIASLLVLIFIRISEGSSCVLQLFPELVPLFSNHTYSNQQSQTSVITLLSSLSHLLQIFLNPTPIITFLRLFLTIFFSKYVYPFCSDSIWISHILTNLYSFSSPNHSTHSNTTEHHLLSFQYPDSLITLVGDSHSLFQGRVISFVFLHAKIATKISNNRLWITYTFLFLNTFNSFNQNCNSSPYNGNNQMIIKIMDQVSIVLRVR